MPTAFLLKQIRFVLILCCAAIFSFAQVLPLPDRYIPQDPQLTPTVITAAGQRLLLSATDVQVAWDSQTQQVRVNRPNWWIINYPLAQITGMDGKTAEERSQLIFGQSYGRLKNWYFRTPGDSPAEPPALDGPAPVANTPNPDLVVAAEVGSASDSNDGTLSSPLKTIGAAIARAKTGSVIHVYPGNYREAIHLTQSGTPGQPIRIEGVASGSRRPVITGNDLFPANAWQRVDGLQGVWRADLRTNLEGPLSANGWTLVERGTANNLQVNEYYLNRGSKEFMNLSVGGDVQARNGDRLNGKSWTRIAAGSDGYVDLGSTFGTDARNSVFWISTNVWITPLDSNWNPDSPRRVTGAPVIRGFRAFRSTGLPLDSQQNQYRIWVNGQLLPSTIYSTASQFEYVQPHPSRDYGENDTWENFPLVEGWNHFVMQVDTSTRPDVLRFRVDRPAEVNTMQTSATAPSDRTRSSGTGRDYASEFMVLGPFQSDRDLGAYIRIGDHLRPNDLEMDLSARRDEIVNIEADFVEFRNFEVRHGAQFQQTSQVLLHGEGILFEGNVLRDTEVTGLVAMVDKQSSATLTVVRNNQILNAGNVGLTAKGGTDQLTAANLNELMPGRSPVLIEHNVVRNSNWTGYPYSFSSGGSKNFWLSNAVFRFNTFSDGSGPGIWLDWEHYRNRIEGNLFQNLYAYSVGVEASPGPNLVANNLSLGIRPAKEYFRAAILSWDSGGTWVVHNTIDNFATDNTVGIDLGVGGNRSTHWGAINDQQAYINNLVIGSTLALNSTRNDVVEGNYLGNSIPASDAGNFANIGTGDYRLNSASALQSIGKCGAYTRFTNHDYYGLLRFPDTRCTVGAFRVDPTPANSGQNLVEYELDDGSMKRMYNTAPGSTTSDAESETAN